MSRQTPSRAALRATAIGVLAGCCAVACGPAPVLARPASGAVAAAAATPAGDAHLLADRPILDRAAAMIEGAAGRVLVEVYEFDAAPLEAAVLAAHRRGLDVRVVTDPSVGASHAEAGRLRTAGVPVREYPLDPRTHQIDHVKLLIAGGAALVGGMNWGAHSGANHDYALEIRDAALVSRATAIFEQDWRFAAGSGRLAVPSPGAAATGLYETAPGREIRDELLDVLRAGAPGDIDAEVFVLTDPEVLAALTRARRLGARVRVLLDARQDVNLASMRQLRSAGVEARWFPMPPGAKLHAKAVLAGGRLLLGSANWSRAGLSTNHELDAETRSPAARAAFATRFEADWTAAPA